VKKLLFFFLSLSLNYAHSQCLVDAILNNADCNHDCTASASAYTSGTAPVSLLWSTGETTTTVSDLCQNNTYYVTLTDGAGCVDVDTLFVPVDSMIFTSTHVNTSCSGCCDGIDSVHTLYNPPPCDQVFYQWIPFGGPPTPYPYQTGLCAGTYTVSASTNCGCFYSWLVTIGVSSTTQVPEEIQGFDRTDFSGLIHPN
jgi:hypothetical protein